MKYTSNEVEIAAWKVSNGDSGFPAAIDAMLFNFATLLRSMEEAKAVATLSVSLSSWDVFADPTQIESLPLHVGEYPLYLTHPPAESGEAKNRLLNALERATRAESALRSLADECDNEMALGWEERIRCRIDEANSILAMTADPREN